MYYIKYIFIPKYLRQHFNPLIIIYNQSYPQKTKLKFNIHNITMISTNTQLNTIIKLDHLK